MYDILRGEFVGASGDGAEGNDSIVLTGSSADESGHFQPGYFTVRTDVCYPEPSTATRCDWNWALEAVGFEEISTLGAIYNFPYYPRHIERAGYAKDTDWLEFEVTLHPEIPEKVERIAAIALTISFGPAA